MVGHSSEALGLAALAETGQRSIEHLSLMSLAGPGKQPGEAVSVTSMPISSFNIKSSIEGCQCPSTQLTVGIVC